MEDSATPEQVNLAMELDEQTKPSTINSATEGEPQISNESKEQSQLEVNSSADSKPSMSTAEPSTEVLDPNKEVLPGNLGDYDEYQHDSPQEIRKNQLKELTGSQSQSEGNSDSKPSTSTAETSTENVDPNKEVLPGNLLEYDEYKHDSPQEIRKNQLKELSPQHTADIRPIHPTRQYSKIQPESYMWLSLFTLIFFSRIFGALALYKSIRVRLLFKDDEHDKAEEASNAAKKLNIIGMLFCMAWVVLIIILIKGFGVFGGT